MKGLIVSPTKLKYSNSSRIQILTALKKLWTDYKTSTQTAKNSIMKSIKLQQKQLNKLNRKEKVKKYVGIFN